MKNSKFKSVLFSIFILLSFCSLFIFTKPVTVEKTISSASVCVKGETKTDVGTDTRPNDYMYTDEDMGNIPFGLFVSSPGGSGYNITDYFPSFTKSTKNESSAVINCYNMDASSRPTFLLSSNSNDEMYFQTVTFVFNDLNGKVGDGTDTNIPETGYLNLTATLNGTPIYMSPTGVNTNDSFLSFSVNLQDITTHPDTYECPLIDQDHLFGDGNPAYRTGLYEFTLSYSYSDNATPASNKSEFSISFNVVDYRSYVEGANSSPFNFINTNTFYTTKEGDDTPTDTNYEVYNYNYTEAPIVELDATKFAINFLYTSGYTNYSFVYDKFAIDYDKNFIDKNIGENEKTGSISLKLKNRDLTYYINTYKQGTRYYVARFDTQDFQDNFLIPNNISTTYQGIYSFDLDFIVQSEKNTTASVEIIDKSLFPEVPNKIANQKMVIFGYQLKYFDQDPSSPTYRRDVTLQKEDLKTFTNFVSFNSSTDTTENKEADLTADNAGFFVKLPKYVAVTDQAPLRFHSYGNLSGTNYSAKFTLIDYNDQNNESVLSDFTKDPTSGNVVENPTRKLVIEVADKKINDKSSSYFQGASISGDGIRIMKLVYTIYLPLEANNIPVTGTQYFIFEINNTVQNLYVQSLSEDRSTSYDFDYYTNKDVRVNLEQKPNTFYAPVSVSYLHSSNFRSDNITSSGNLFVKQDGDVDYEYTVNNKNYHYFVTNQTNDYTFENSGYYKLTIKSVISNVPKTYSFKIDKKEFSNVVLNKAVLNGTNYVKSATTLSSSRLTGVNSEYLKYDLYIADTAFTMSWDEKTSGADSYSYVYYMEAADDSIYNSSLFKISSDEYWLTNGIKLNELSSPIDNYENSVRFATDGSTKEFLKPTNYFNKDGIYYFYVFDEAGNFFTRIILVDSSLSSTLQGYWEDNNNEENSNWVNTFDPEKNPANYVNNDTTIYFGTHKALRLPNMSKEITIQFEDISFTRAYNLADEGKLQPTKPPISFGFYEKVLNILTNYIQTTSKTPLINNAPSGNYLTLENTVLQYRKEPTAVDLVTEQVIGEVTTGTISEIYKAKIYATKDTSKDPKYGFVDEAYYDFTITNINGKQALKQICMNFDTIQGTFKAYGNDDGEIEQHIIRKNSGTNLNFLRFEYNKLDDETAEYYSLKSLTYDYYEFILDDSSSNSSETAYPFAKSATQTGIDMLSTQILDGDRSIYYIDPINISSTNNTLAGKYILTRTYKGGNYKYIGERYVSVGEGNGNYSFNGETYTFVGEGNGDYRYTDGSIENEYSFDQVTDGGDYYKNDEGDFKPLFTLDSLIRKYIVYVDHNGIITSYYMLREDNTSNIREVGDKISIFLSNGLDEEWNFKEFFLTTSGSLTLDTNKVPVKINIPLSKYFAFYNTITENLYSKLNFATLEVSIFYSRSIYSEWIEYKVDGYNLETGMCTCSKLVSNTNKEGNLIFSAAGSYRIVINDRTGYSDTSIATTNANNMFPTTYEYNFEISHDSPYADMYKETYNYQKETFETTILTNEDGSNNFATNIKKQNEGANNNQVLIKWSDPITPYNARVNQVDIEVIFNNTRTNIAIDLKQFNLYDYANGTNALDLELIENSSFIVYFKVFFFENNPAPSIYDNKEYFRYSYEISVDITEEYIYNVTLSYVSNSDLNQSYIGDNGESYSDTLYKLTIDRTKPFTNISSLINNEDYLKQLYRDLDINTFKEENFDVSNIEDIPSAFTYSFGVNQSFKLNYNNEDTTSYFYVRNFNNYDDQYISITPDMVDTVYTLNKAYYSDFSTFSINYPRFTEIGINNNGQISVGSYKWYRIDYNQDKSLYDLISSATSETPKGFYEVIEKDYAGNFRNFTVYFTEFGTGKDYLTLTIDGYNGQGYSKVDNEADSEITAKQMFRLSELNTKFGWGKVVIKNETTDVSYDKAIYFSPFDTYTEIRDRIDALNEFLTFDYDYNEIKISVTLSKYNSAFPSVTRGINIIKGDEDVRLQSPIIEEIVNVSTGTVSYNLKFPTYTSKTALYLEGLKLNLLVGNTWVNKYSYTGKSKIPEKITGLSKGIYQAVYSDNYNKELSYSYIVYVGEYYINNFDTEFKFEHSTYAYDQTNKVYYSGGNITVTYEANIYSVWVNGKNISGDRTKESLSTTLGKYNCKTFTLTSDHSYEDIPAYTAVGGETYYQIVYRDVTDNSIQKTYNFYIYNALPEILLTNAYGGKVTSTLEESNSQITSSYVTINWGELTGCEYNQLNDGVIIDEEINVVTNAILYTKNKNGEYKNGIIISKGQTITEEGYYKLRLQNTKLGNYREIYFVIQFGDFPLYTVTVDGTEIKPSKLETFNLTSTANEKLQAKGKDNEYSSIIKVIYSALNDLTFNKVDDKNKLIAQLGFDAKGDHNLDNVGMCNLTNIPHYYSTSTVDIIYNSNVKLNIIEFCFFNNTLQKAYIADGENNNPTPSNVGTDYWTTIYLVYDLEGTIRIEFFAVTKVPKTNSLLEGNLLYENEKSNSSISTILFSRNSTNYTLTNTEIKDSDIVLIWNKITNNATEYWYNQGNIIYVKDKYGVNTEYDELEYKKHSTKDNDKEYLTSTITGSGAHNLVFSDLAGNIHEFASNTYAPQSYYMLYLIDSVIYHINYQDKDYNPIQYGVFNDELTLVIEKEYVHNYSSLEISVSRNGNMYTSYEELDSYTLKFAESGRYVVKINALYGTAQTSLNPVVYNFTILNSDSARLAYEFVEIPGYEILQVIKNNQDITDSFERNDDGKITSLFVSSTEKGNGLYTITMKYGKRDTDTLTYSFSINNYIPTISCNVSHGETTTGSIVIYYNPSTIYEQLGECYIKILTYNNDSKTFYKYVTIYILGDNIVNSSAKSFEITRSNSYFIQVETKSGNILSSFRVNKKDPLNAVAIIIIVVAVIAVVVLIIVVVKLRTKMKIK